MTDDPWDDLPEDHPSHGRSYRVGKCRPPESGRFQVGSKGNRKGRPRGAKNVVTQIKDVFQQLIPVTTGGKTRKVPRLVAQAQVLSNKGLGGDARANRESFALARSLGLLPESEPDNMQGIDPMEQAIIDDFLGRMAPSLPKHSKTDAKKKLKDRSGDDKND